MGEENRLMAIYQDPKTKKWYASISFTRDNEVKHTTKRGFGSKREAQKFELDFRYDLGKPFNQITYKSAVEAFLKDKKGNRKVSTYSELERLSSTYFSSLNEMQISSIKVTDYQKIRNNLFDLEKSVSYKNKIISLMKSISRFISSTYQIVDNAASLSNITDYSIPNEMKTWNPTEFQEFQSNLNREIYRDLFHILFFTGARLGEIRALYKTDFRDDKISISKSIRNMKDNVTTPKNRYSVRTVSLDKATIDIVKRYSMQKGRFLLGNESCLSQSNIDRIFKSTIAKVQERNPDFPIIRVHDLRHSHATILINRGANIVAVSKRLGHANVGVTLKTYTHLMKESNSKLISILDEMKIVYLEQT